MRTIALLGLLLLALPAFGESRIGLATSSEEGGWCTTHGSILHLPTPTDRQILLLFRNGADSGKTVFLEELEVTLTVEAFHDANITYDSNHYATFELFIFNTDQNVTAHGASNPATPMCARLHDGSYEQTTGTGAIYYLYQTPAADTDLVEIGSNWTTACTVNCTGRTLMRFMARPAELYHVPTYGLAIPPGTELAIRVLEWASNNPQADPTPTNSNFHPGIEVSFKITPGGQL